MACSEHSAGLREELLLANWFRFTYRGKASPIAGPPEGVGHVYQVQELEGRVSFIIS